MAEPRIIDLYTLNFKPSSIAPVHPDTTPPPALEAAISLLRAVSGIETLHLGRQLEDEDDTTWVLVSTWTSRSDADEFSMSASWMPFHAALRSASDGAEGCKTRRLEILAAPGADIKEELLGDVLQAPCTEIFTTMGSNEKYWEGVGVFATAMNKADPGEVAGFTGIVYGRDALPANTEASRETTVSMMLGWESMEAHYEAKGKPGLLLSKIQEHMSTGWKSCHMGHVNFKQL